MVGMDRVRLEWIAQRHEVAAAVGGRRYAAEPWPTDGIRLVARGRSLRQISRLLLLHQFAGPQDHSPGNERLALVDEASAVPRPHRAGDRRHAHVAIWP